MTESIVVYSKPACPQCEATKASLDSLGADYRVIDVTEDPDALDYVKNTLGYSQAPVVEVEGATWSGHNPALIKEFCS